MKLLTTVGSIAKAARGEEDYVARVQNQEVDVKEIKELNGIVEYIGVTDEFKQIVDEFKTPEGELPAGFRLEYKWGSDKVLRADLVRDISYDKNNKLRPTNLLFSADSANPYEVAPISNLISNLTCNPGIIYDLFINNPKANVGNKFKNRDEVMEEIGRILGPGADISVELNDPFGKSETEILEEAAKFKEMLSKHRVVIKVPHTGPVSKENVNQLLSGNKLFSKRYNDVSTADAFRGHNMALMLHEHGYRVNFTLMFEPYQTALALQARPYFINSFIRHRLIQTEAMQEYLNLYNATSDSKYLEILRQFMVEKDYLAAGDTDFDLFAVKAKAEHMLKYRNFDNAEGSDGLDGIRHNLRLLRQTNMDDTRLIICSMEGDSNYPDIDRLLASDEYGDMARRVVLTAEPNYLAQFTSANQVVSYQRRFMNAANGMK